MVLLLLLLEPVKFPAANVCDALLELHTIDCLLYCFDLCRQDALDRLHQVPPFIFIGLVELVSRGRQLSSLEVRNLTQILAP